LQFTDDTDLIAESPEQLQELTGKVNDCAKCFGLKTNINKTKTMTMSNWSELTNFVYLGLRSMIK